jgi:predicted lipoprotein with Yx(FWY)xxD motif
MDRLGVNGSNVTMKRTLLLLAACAGIAGGCGASESDRRAAGESAGSAKATEVASSEPTQGTGSRPGRRRGPPVVLRDSQFGPVLFSARGRALYRFTRDGQRRSRCYGECARAWPPFFTRGRARAGRGVTRSLLGSIRRRDGRRQVTYRGQPLYFYVHDPRGQVLCNDVVEFGGTWLALDAKGNPPTT